MSNERYKKLGVEKQIKLDRDFDRIYETYRDKALKQGYSGELRFVKERGKVIIYIVI